MLTGELGMLSPSLATVGAAVAAAADRAATVAALTAREEVEDEDDVTATELL